MVQLLGWVAARASCETAIGNFPMNFSWVFVSGWLLYSKSVSGTDTQNNTLLSIAHPPTQASFCVEMYQVSTYLAFATGFGTHWSEASKKIQREY